MGGHASLEQSDAGLCSLPPEGEMSSESGGDSGVCSLPGPSESESSNPLLQTATFMNSASEPVRGAIEAHEVPEALHEHHETVESGAGLFSAAPQASSLYGPDGQPLAGAPARPGVLLGADGQPIASTAAPASTPTLYGA